MKAMADIQFGFQNIGFSIAPGPAFDWDARIYEPYFATIADALPLNARNFAGAAWHYNALDPRCPHDAWLESLAITEPSTGPRSETRDLEVHMRLLGAYHDGHIEIGYRAVERYELCHIGRSTHGRHLGHGDWLIDEIRLLPDGGIAHEILFTGAHIVIECDDLAYSWLPLDGPCRYCNAFERKT